MAGNIGDFVGGFISSGGYGRAGDMMGGYGQDAMNRAYNIAQQNRNEASPWTQSGLWAQNEIDALLGLGTLKSNGEGFYGLDQSNRTGAQNDAYGRFRTDPGYQFRLDQGLKAVGNSGSARGMTLSGAQSKALNDYGQGQASQEYGNYFNRLAGVSGQGATLTNSTNALNTQAQDVGNQLNFQSGMGRSSAYANASNALAKGIGSGVNFLTDTGLGLAGAFI